MFFANVAYSAFALHRISVSSESTSQSVSGRYEVVECHAGFPVTQRAVWRRGRIIACVVGGSVQSGLATIKFFLGVKVKLIVPFITAYAEPSLADRIFAGRLCEIVELEDKELTIVSTNDLQRQLDSTTPGRPKSKSPTRWELPLPYSTIGEGVDVATQRHLTTCSPFSHLPSACTAHLFIRSHIHHELDGVLEPLKINHRPPE